jgi:hypothetical protein
MPPTLIGVIHTEPPGCPSTSAIIDSVVSMGKRSRTRKAVRAKRPGPKAIACRSSTKLIVGGRGEADGGQAKLRRRGFSSAGNGRSDHGDGKSENEENKDICAGST